ncbi:MAG: hypothetical protein ACJ761_07555 [Chloroflexota bacterium]
MDRHPRRWLDAFRQPQPVDGLPVPEVADPSAAEPPDVEFVAYGEDFVVSGRTTLDADRLSDMLNGHEEYELRDVRLDRLDGGEAVDVTEIVLHRDQVLLVHAAGPRGDVTRRHRTQQQLLEFQIGPYHLTGYFHGLPGADAVAALRRRRPIVPLTEVWVEAPTVATPFQFQVDAILINREQIGSVRAVYEDEPVAVERDAIEDAEVEAEMAAGTRVEAVDR